MEGSEDRPAAGWDTGDVDPPTCIAVNSGQSHITALSRHTDTHSRYSRSGTRESVRLVGIASTDKGIELVMMRDATSILTHNERAHNRRATCATMFSLVSPTMGMHNERAHNRRASCAIMFSLVSPTMDTHNEHAHNRRATCAIMIYLVSPTMDTHNERAHNRRATCAIMFPLISTNRDKRIDRAQKLVSACMF